MANEIDRGERDDHDEELGEPVGPVGEMQDDSRAVQDGLLKIVLDEQVEVALDADDDLAVRDRRPPVARNGPADGLVGGGEAGPQRGLPDQIRPAARRES